MTKYVNIKETFNPLWHLINFNLEEFVNTQQIIVNHYEKEEDLLISNLGCKEFIKSFDKYILHTIEEVSETYEELSKDNLHDKMEEMIDILMYLGSMNYILKANMKNYKMKYESFFDYDYYVQVYENRSLKSYQNNTCLLKIVDLLIKQRRLFPQRKWHKPSKEFSELEIKHNLKLMYDLNISAMKIVLNLLLDTSIQDINLINGIINEKQQKVISLPLPTQK